MHGNEMLWFCLVITSSLIYNVIDLTQIDDDRCKLFFHNKAKRLFKGFNRKEFSVKKFLYC